MADLIVRIEDSAHVARIARAGSPVWRCTVGYGGIHPDKREGDGRTPVGRWPLREVLYRPDRVEPPRSRISVRPIEPDEGWVDEPADPAYNRRVKLPYPARHEALWRYDALYDVVVVLGFNDDPPRPFGGSAIFLHLARDTYGPTAGCVGLALPHLLDFLAQAGPRDAVEVLDAGLGPAGPGAAASS